MKYINKILLAAMASLPFVSCIQETIEKGEPENDSYGVYFETLTAARKSVEFDPSEKAELTFTAYRTKESDDITVPLEVQVTGAENAESLFTTTDLVFADGQLESKFSVKFPDAALGTTYNVSISCVDEQYVKIYSQNPTTLSFKITRVKWNRVLGPNGEQYGTWIDDIVRGAYGVPKAVNDKIEVYERADKPGFYRIKQAYGPYMVAQFFGATPEEVAGNCKEVWNYIDATNAAKVYLPVQEAGCTLNPKEGFIRFASRCQECGFSGSSFYGTNVNGVIHFPKEGILVGFDTAPNDFYLSNKSGETTIILPGCKDFDYSMNISVGYAKEGNYPVKFTMGADLAKISYNFFEGKIAAADLRTKALEVARDPNANFVTETGLIQATLPNTGIYTLVAVGIDAKGVLQNYSSKEVHYVCKDETMPVEIAFGIGSAAKYGAQGINTNSAVEVYAYGRDLTAVKMAVVSKLDLITNEEAVMNSLINSKGVSKEILAEINGDGYTTVVNNLMPGTEYLLLIYASNGYEQSIFVTEDSEKTTGSPKPVYQDFKEPNMELLPQTKDQYYGTYNMYAILPESETGLREYVGKVEISDGGVVGEGEAMQDLIKVENFWGPIGDQLNMDDTIMLEFAGGALYTLEAKFGPVAKMQGLYAGNIYLVGNQFYGVDSRYIMFAAYVKEGYISFFSNNPKDPDLSKFGLGFFEDGNYNKFAGVGFSFDKVLFVDETMDNNGLAPKAKAVAKMTRPNYVELNADTFDMNMKFDNKRVNIYTPSYEIKGHHNPEAVKATISEFTGEFVEDVTPDHELRTAFKNITR